MHFGYPITLSSPPPPVRVLTTPFTLTPLQQQQPLSSPPPPTQQWPTTFAPPVKIVRERPTMEREDSRLEATRRTKRQKTIDSPEEVLLYEHPFSNVLEYVADFWHVLMASGNVMESYGVSVSGLPSNSRKGRYTDEPFPFALLRSQNVGIPTDHPDHNWRFEPMCCDLSVNSPSEFIRSIRVLTQTDKLQSHWTWKPFPEFDRECFAKSILMYCPRPPEGRPFGVFEANLKKHWFFKMFLTPLILTQHSVTKNLLNSQFVPGLYKTDGNFSFDPRRRSNVGCQSASTLQVSNTIKFLHDYVNKTWKDPTSSNRHLLCPTVFKVTNETKQLLCVLSSIETITLNGSLFCPQPDFEEGNQELEEEFTKFKRAANETYKVSMDPVQSQWFDVLFYDLQAPNIRREIEGDTFSGELTPFSVRALFRNRETGILNRTGKTKSSIRILSKEEAESLQENEHSFREEDERRLFWLQQTRLLAGKIMLPIFRGLAKESPKTVMKYHHGISKVLMLFVDNSDRRDLSKEGDLARVGTSITGVSPFHIIHTAPGPIKRGRGRPPGVPICQNFLMGAIMAPKAPTSVDLNHQFVALSSLMILRFDMYQMLTWIAPTPVEDELGTSLHHQHNYLDVQKQEQIRETNVFQWKALLDYKNFDTSFGCNRTVGTKEIEPSSHFPDALFGNWNGGGNGEYDRTADEVAVEDFFLDNPDWSSTQSSSSSISSPASPNKPRDYYYATGEGLYDFNHGEEQSPFDNWVDGNEDCELT